MGPVVISLPIADRQASYRFYGAGLGLRAVGELADDGVPEPLQFELNDGARLMLVPTGGFGWVIGDHEVAPPGSSECMIGIGADTTAAVDAMIECVRQAGAKIVTQPAQQP